MVIELPDWMGLQGLPWLYTAAQMHLHWASGGPGHGGSEHTVDGESADAEVARAGVSRAVGNHLEHTPRV